MKKIFALLHSTPLHTYAIVLVIVFSFLVRSFGRDWDGFTHMHPDERMLMMVTEKISIPDKMYPDFFNYGTLPIYLLRTLAQLASSQYGTTNIMTSYGPGLLSLGRFLSTIFDIGTILAIYITAKFAFGKKQKNAALLAALIYGMMFFPIQNSHFFVVDVFVTFFLTWATFFMLIYIRTKDIKWLLLQAAFIGFSVASKFTAVLFVPGSLLTIAAMGILSTKGSLWPKKATSIAISISLWSILSLGAFAITMPYAILPPSGILAKFAKSESDQSLVFSSKAVDETINDFKTFFTKEEFPTIRFLRDMKEQTRMNSSPYHFPYTLQYAGTMPYIYYINNVLLWGIGPLISILLFMGIFVSIKKVSVRNLINVINLKKPVSESVIFVIFFCFSYLLFFTIIGKSAVKFMRYMLPLYPLLAIIAAHGLTTALRFKPSTKYIHVFNAAKITSVIFAVLWAIAFLNIYTEKNTRALATDWILENIPQNSVLGTEHWDDRVPIHSGEYYKYEDITMYDRPDNATKWALMREKFNKIDYYIVASNRLYAPLQRLTDCQAHKDSCYPIASRFYADLLTDKTQFKKVAEFTNYPHLGSFAIPDDNADESFTVYDHPKIIIFKKTN